MWPCVSLYVPLQVLHSFVEIFVLASPLLAEKRIRTMLMADTVFNDLLVASIVVAE